jgi:surfeit locus 1 family protein
VGSRAGNPILRVGIAPTLVVALLVPVLVALGLWQLQRADEKRRIAADFEAGAAPVDVHDTGALRALGELPRFQAVRLSGRYVPERQFLLDNMTDGGAAGYRVLTPFHAEGSDVWIIVDRGWVAKSHDGRLPDVAVDDGVRSIEGRTSRLPRPGLELAGKSAIEGSWPRIVQFPRLSDLETILDRSLAGAVVLLDPAAEHGFLRRWQPIDFGPERHLGYAVQWFALATTLLIIFIYFNFIRSRHDDR